jgi:C-terminal processing protease CtpA/Prc
MGAGGNVVGYNQAPNSHFDVRQTESLMVRKDGSYIENVGVKPDVAVPVANYTATKYKEVRDAAVKAFK